MKLLRILVVLTTGLLFPGLASAQVVINEMMTNNQNSITDADGDHSDWIELFNTTASPVNLNGYKLSDNIDSLNKWLIPNYTLGPGNFIRIWCSGKNRLSTPFHTNFSIDSQGEGIFLSDPSGTVIDNIGAVYLPPDVSYGHLPNGSGNLVYLSVATPAASNNAASGLSGALDQKPSFGTPGGFYTDSLYVSLSHIDPSVTIRYTLDGSDPTEQSPAYSSPILVRNRAGDTNYYSMIRTCYKVHFWLPDWNVPAGEVFKSTVIRARAFKSGFLPGPVQTQTYFVDPAMFSRYGSLPVVSVVSDPRNLFNDTTGIYVPGITYVPNTFQANYYQDWKRPANIEMYMPGGQPAFNSNFKISINGISSRSSPQKGLNVNASTDYGDSKIRYPLFANTPGKARLIDSFDRIKLRAWGSDRDKALFRDAYSTAFMHRSALDYEAYRPCVVFINGEYWGLQEIRERNRAASFYEEHYLIDSKNPGVDVVDLQSHEPIEGDTAEWNALYNFIITQNLADTANFNYVESKVDLNSLLLHYMFSIYFARGDWPIQNEAVWRPRTNDGKWKWIMWDMDNTVAHYLNPWYDMFNLTLNGSRGYGPSDHLNALLQYPQFRFDFINIFCDWMNTEFQASLMQNEVDRMKAELSPYFQEFTDRWQTNYNWTAQTDSMKWWVGLRAQFVKQHLQTNFLIPAEKQLTLNVSDTLKGNIQVNTVRLDANTIRTTALTFPWSGDYFPSVPVPVTAIAKPGYRFVKWLPSNDTARSISLLLINDTSLTAVFDIDTSYHPLRPLVINEAMASNTATIADNYGEYDDWVEIYNPNPVEVDIAGWYLTDNLILPTRFRLAEGSDSTKIPPYGHLLIWTDDDTEQGILHANFKFNAAGDFVALYRPDEIFLEDSISIPSLSTDLSYGRSYDGSANWIVFTNTTPGETNMEVVSGIAYINEVMSTNTSVIQDEYGQYEDWIELYNPGQDTLNIAGWFLSDDPAQPQKFRFAFANDSLKIPPYGFKVIWADTQTEQGVLHVNFNLSSAGECLQLTKADGVTLSDSLCFGGIAANESRGRNYDGSSQWITFQPSTPRQTNATIPAQNLLINEFMTVNLNSVVDNFGEHDPWIELYNPNSDTIDLAGWFISDNASYPEKFRFPFGLPDTRIAPGDHLLIWADGQISQGPLHLNYRLNTSAGCIYLYKPDDITISDAKCYGAIAADESLGREHDGATGWITFTVPTPDAVNWLYTSDIVQINEVQAVNASTIADGNGQFDPWIELYNPNPDTMDISGWHLSDDPLDPSKYRLGYDNDSLTIAPGGFLLLWADNTPSQGIRHLGFTLAATGSCITLSKPDVSFTDSVCYGALAQDDSWGRQSDGASLWQVFSIPTPDSNNVDLSIGVPAVSSSASLSVFPNPVHGQTLRFNRMISFTLFDARGKQVAREEKCVSYPSSQLATGVYLLVTDDGARVRVVVY